MTTNDIFSLGGAGSDTVIAAVDDNSSDLQALHRRWADLRDLDWELNRDIDEREVAAGVPSTSVCVNGHYCDTEAEIDEVMKSSLRPAELFSPGRPGQEAARFKKQLAAKTQACQEALDAHGIAPLIEAHEAVLDEFHAVQEEIEAHPVRGIGDLVVLLDVVLDTEFHVDLSCPDWLRRSAELAFIRGLAALAPGAVFTSLRRYAADTIRFDASGVPVAPSAAAGAASEGVEQAARGERGPDVERPAVARPGRGYRTADRHRNGNGRCHQGGRDGGEW